MTCKDCVHAEICKKYSTMIFEDESLVELKMSNEEFDNCEHFKARSRFVELPCKIGDVVWFIKGKKNPLVRCGQVKEITLDRLYGFIVRCICQNFTGVFYVDVFSTSEEAEQALKEGEKECGY